MSIDVKLLNPTALYNIYTSKVKKNREISGCEYIFDTLTWYIYILVQTLICCARGEGCSIGGGLRCYMDVKESLGGLKLSNKSLNGDLLHTYGIRTVVCVLTSLSTYACRDYRNTMVNIQFFYRCWRCYFYLKSLCVCIAHALDMCLTHLDIRLSDFIINMTSKIMLSFWLL